jgi:K+-transporting ATPase KdpF subunit
MLLIALTFIAISPERVQNSAGSENLDYLAGIIIAVFILGYLLYSLLKPEKF